MEKYFLEDALKKNGFEQKDENFKFLPVINKGGWVCYVEYDSLYSNIETSYREIKEIEPKTLYMHVDYQKKSDRFIFNVHLYENSNKVVFVFLDKKRQEMFRENSFLLAAGAKIESIKELFQFLNRSVRQQALLP